ncbi:MAG: hypothetical protein HC790_06490 [Acaryochloridaceae cyanobacterium CSU_3_4]|nr:hypothetical protein [Acaryochloridaceae cyanobacterium CSU_3_4]
MTPTSALYDALNDFLSQCQDVWKDIRHVQTLCWMMIGIIQSQKVHLNGFGVYVRSRATYAQSHQRRFRRWLSNRRIDIIAAHHSLVSHALSQWGNERMYLSLDTTLVWNCFCIVWVGVVYRGRTVPIAWRVWFLSSAPDPHLASKKQSERSLEREFILLRRLPVSWFCQSSRVSIPFAGGHYLSRFSS